MGAPAAYASVSFTLTEPAARAGDLVHFSISGTEGPVTYELEIADKEVLESVGGVGGALGTFTMPDLGAAPRTVTVEAEIRESDDGKKVKRALQYLGPALPIIGPPAPAAVPPPTASPEPIYSPVDETSAAPAPRPRLNRRPRDRHARRAIELQRHVAPGGEHRGRAHVGRRHRQAANRHAHSRRLPPRTSPLFDGIPEPGAETRRGERNGTAFPTRTAALAAADVAPGDDGGANAAVMIPALLGLAAVALAGTALMRRRRVASRPSRD